MAERYRVLLIGIDDYPGAPLDGCVNDVDAIQWILVDRLGIPTSQITRLVAPRAGGAPGPAPTIDNLWAAFAALASDEVRPDDRVFIYFSGHGTQVQVVEPGGARYVREALVPAGEVEPGQGRYLFDWDLNRFLSRIAARAGAVTFILDACTSAAASREARASRGHPRHVHSPYPYVMSAGEEPPAPGDHRGFGGSALGDAPSCVVVSACLPDEQAVEAAGEDNVVRGELTRALVEQLAAVPTEELPGLEWSRVWRGVVAKVVRVQPAQHPSLQGDLRGLVFGGRSEAFAFSLPFAAAESALESMGGPGERRVDPKLRVTLMPHDDAIAQSLAESPLLTVTGAGQPHDVALERRKDGSWAVTDDMFGTGEGSDEDDPVLVIVPPSRLERARAVLEHYRRYSAPIRLARWCKNLGNALTVRLLDCNGRAPSPAAGGQDTAGLHEVAPGVRAPYELRGGSQAEDSDLVAVLVENNSSAELRVTVFVCATDGKVERAGEGAIAARSKRVFWAEGVPGQPFRIWMPPGRTLGVDRVCVFGTTDPNATLDHLQIHSSFLDALGPDRVDEDLGRAGLGGTSEGWASAVTAYRIARRFDAAVIVTGRDEMSVTLSVGSNAGATVGSRWAIYSSSTKDREKLAVVEITQVRRLDSAARILSEAGKGVFGLGARTEEEEHFYEDQRLRVTLEGPAETVGPGAQLRMVLSSSDRLNLVEEGGDPWFRVRLVSDGSAGWVVEENQTRKEVSQVEAISPFDLLYTLEKIARYRAVLGLFNPNRASPLAGRIDLVIKRQTDSERWVAVEPGERVPALRDKEAIILEIWNRYTDPVYVSLFDFDASFAIALVYPFEEQNPWIKAGESAQFYLDLSWSPGASGEVAIERLKLFATLGPTDLGAVLRQEGARELALSRDGSSTELWQLMDMAFTGRGAGQRRPVRLPPDQEWTTVERSFEIRRGPREG